MLEVVFIAAMRIASWLTTAESVRLKLAPPDAGDEAVMRASGVGNPDGVRAP